MQRLTLAEMAARLKLSSKTFSRDVRVKGIPFYAAGKRMRFDPFEVEAYIRTIETEERSQVKVIPFKRKGKLVSRRFAEA